MADPIEDATLCATRCAEGDPTAAEKLLPLVYSELRNLAGAFLRRERRGHSLQATDLVHEAYLRLVDITRIDWQGKSHFLAMAARQMRRVLVDHARARRAKKRGGDPLRVTLSEGIVITSGPDLDVLDLHQALERLAALSPRQSEVATLRFFGGLTDVEVGCVLHIAERTVREDWKVARAWLARELQQSQGS